MILNDALQFPLASNMAHRAHRTTRNAKKRKTATNFFQLFNFRYDIERTDSSSFFVSFHVFPDFFSLPFSPVSTFPFAVDSSVARLLVGTFVVVRWLYINIICGHLCGFFHCTTSNEATTGSRTVLLSPPPTPSLSTSVHETSKEKQLSFDQTQTVAHATTKQ